MVNTATQLLALLTNASDLTAAIGRPYGTVWSTLWHLPDDVTYPVLAIHMDDTRGSVPLAISEFFSEPRLKCWFLSELSSPFECMQFADALRAKLHLQSRALLDAGLLSANLVEWVDTRIGKDAQTDKHQAYVEFKLIA